MDTLKKIEVMKAFVEGSKIEFSVDNEDEWSEWNYPDEAPVWNWENTQYRVKEDLEGDLRYLVQWLLRSPFVGPNLHMQDPIVYKILEKYRAEG